MPDRPKSCNVALAIVAIPQLLLGYVLSIGPANRMANDGMIPIDLFLRIYAPIVPLSRALPPVGEAIEEWEILWLSHSRTDCFE